MLPLPTARRVLLAAAIAALCGSAAAQASVPGDMDERVHGTVVTGDCSVLDNATADHLDQWVVFSVQPDRRHTEGGDQLIPYPYPKRAESIEPTATGYGPQYEGGETRVGDTDACKVSAYNPFATRLEGAGIAIDEPGIYLHQQVRQTVNWHVVSADDHTDPQPCNGNDKEFPEPAARLDPPATDPGPNAKWAISTYCTTVTAHRFTVVNDEGDCPTSQDRTQWPTAPYFNQYDAGAAEDLPTSSNRKGGNACGPSSVLMGALESLKRNFPGDSAPHLEALKYMIESLPTLGETYDSVMGLTRAQITTPNTQNVAYGGKAVAWLKSLGWSQAELVALGSSQADVLYGNQDKIVKALTREPVLISTAFGTSRWGTAGGGHVILLRNLDVQHPLDYIVDDPAGNWFSTRGSAWYPNGHYGPGSCGFGVAYPMNWVHAYTAGRWMVKFGTPDGAWAQTVRSARTTGAPVQPPGQSVFAVQASGAGAPRTLYVQDAQGRRAGLVDGTVVEEIPNADAGVATEGDSGPGDDSDTPAGDVPSTEVRYLVVPRPTPGTTLHVGDPGGGTFALQTTAWDHGRVTAAQDLQVTTAPGQDTTADAPVLWTATGATPDGAPQAGGGATTPAPSGGQGTPSGTPSSSGAAPRLVRARGGRGAIRATLRCTAARGTCTARLVVRAHRTVVGRATVRLRAGTSRTVTVRLNGAGRRALRRSRSLGVRVTVVTGGRTVARSRLLTVTRA